MLSTELFLNMNYLLNNVNLGKITVPQCVQRNLMWQTSEACE